MTMCKFMSGELALGIAITLLGLAPAIRGQGDGARAYWKTLAGANAVTYWPIQAKGNFNPFDAARVVNPSASFEANMALIGYHKSLPFFGRSTTASLILPVGNLSGDVSGNAVSEQNSASGFGDPMVQWNVNLFGAPAMKDLPSVMRYEPVFTLDVLASLAIPVGEYDGNQTLNLGQNRWYGRIGAPMMFSLGTWVPGKRTTFEVMPSLWVFGDNDDVGNQTLETNPIFGVEMHLTRDFTESFWGSLDATNFNGGKSTLNGVQGSSLNNIGLGFTMGFQVSDNLQVSTSYFSTINDGGTGDMQGDQFRIMFTYGWHPLIEGMNRLNGHD